MKAIVVKARLHWGFSVKKPVQSAAQEPLLYPPPSTLIGALARGYASLKGLGERLQVKGSLYSPTVRVLDKVYYATIAIHDAAILHQDMNRNITGVYMRPIHRKDPKNWFGVQAMGKTLSINGKCTILYILREPDRDLALSAWSLLCLGSKESLVSVNDVDYVDTEVLGEEGPYEVEFYVKADTCVLPPTETVHVLEFWDYQDINLYRLGFKPKIRLDRYYAPYKPLKDTMMIAYVTGEGVPIRIGEHIAIIPKPPT